MLLSCHHCIQLELLALREGIRGELRAARAIVFLRENLTSVSDFRGRPVFHPPHVYITTYTFTVLLGIPLCRNDGFSPEIVEVSVGLLN